mmetsp:Transcript_3909/g.13667  ORF Transcript_3909/g.13667 Transcript_3909/m.13667 type:complete len:246 (+) Transcript_3909:1378-2115(+)
MPPLHQVARRISTAAPGRPAEGRNEAVCRRARRGLQGAVARRRRFNALCFADLLLPASYIAFGGQGRGAGPRWPLCEPRQKNATEQERSRLPVRAAACPQRHRRIPFGGHRGRVGRVLQERGACAVARRALRAAFKLHPSSAQTLLPRRRRRLGAHPGANRTRTASRVEMGGVRLRVRALGAVGGCDFRPAARVRASLTGPRRPRTSSGRRVAPRRRHFGAAPRKSRHGDARSRRPRAPATSVKL